MNKKHTIPKELCVFVFFCPCLSVSGLENFSALKYIGIYTMKRSSVSNETRSESKEGVKMNEKKKMDTEVFFDKAYALIRKAKRKVEKIFLICKADLAKKEAKRDFELYEKLAEKHKDDMIWTPRNFEDTWISEEDSELDDLYLDEPFEKKNESEEAMLVSEKGLPIMLIPKKKLTPMERISFDREHRVESVYELVNLPLEIDEISIPCRIPFEHKDTDCELILDKNTALYSEEGIPNKVIIRRPEVYYRLLTDSERFPCECLCVVDEKTLALFKPFKDLREKAEQIAVFCRLARAQKEFVVSMANRPIQKDEDHSDAYAPIRDLDALEMMYEVCKHTYEPSVRSRIESLKAQLEHLHGSERADLINQLALSVAIDTQPHPRPKRTYEECMAIMDKHIYGLKDVKERIVEFIITLQETGSSFFVMLLVGPYGVGKTSLVVAVSECLWNMPILQIDCAGSDILKIKGLWKSYGGAKSGEVVDGFFDRGKTEQLILLDEIDKMEPGRDGDPRGAFIKPLGPQRKFYDEYLAGDIDVSASKFIATANDISKIPGYILSRFENCVFQIDPYTEEEKIEIAQKHLIPKILTSEFNLTEKDCFFEEEALKVMIRNFCEDEGVRDLSGNIKILLRKIITQKSRGFFNWPFSVTAEYVRTNLKKNGHKSPMKKVGY